MRILVLLVVLLAGINVSACGSASDEANAASEAGWIPGLEGVKSGEIEASFTMNNSSGDSQIYMRLLGSFLGAGEGKLPRVDVGVEATGQVNGEKVDFYTALITGPHRAALTSEGEVYEMMPKTFDPVRSSFEGALGDGSAADMYACLEAAAGIDLSRIAGRTMERNPAGTADDKTKVTIETTELKPSTLSAALRALMKDPGCGAQLQMAGSMQKALEGAAGAFEDGMKEGEVETFVDRSGLLRELRVKAVLDSKGKGKTEAEFVYSVSHVNEVTELPPCTGEKPIEALFHNLGFNPLKALEAGAPGLGGLLEGIYARALA
ncbi:MAG: hypothetical protein ACTHKT_05125 [Solirubrobacterales bacterium]